MNQYGAAKEFLRKIVTCGIIIILYHSTTLLGLYHIEAHKNTLKWMLLDVTGATKIKLSQGKDLKSVVTYLRIRALFIHLHA